MNELVKALKDLGLRSDLESGYIVNNTIKNYSGSHEDELEKVEFAVKVRTMVDEVTASVRAFYAKLIEFVQAGWMNEEDFCYVMDVYKAIINQEVTSPLEDIGPEWSRINSEDEKDGGVEYSHLRYPSLIKIETSGAAPIYYDMKRVQLRASDMIGAYQVTLPAGLNVVIEEAIHKAYPIKMPYIPEVLRVYVEYITDPITETLCAVSVWRIVAMNQTNQRVKSEMTERDLPSLNWKVSEVISGSEGAAVEYTYEQIDKRTFVAMYNMINERIDALEKGKGDKNETEENA